jgi:hypothetical protein
MEQKIKNLLGEYAFTISVLQHQLEQVQRELEDLRNLGSAEAKLPKKEKDENKS